MPIEQALATQAAWSRSAEWLQVEIEVETDAGGAVQEVRVVQSSGRRAFDRFAAAQVRRHVAEGGAPPEPALSRWRCEAGYWVSDSRHVGLTFDDSMLFNRQARKRLALVHPLKQGVRTRGSLRWVRALREPRGPLPGARGLE